MTNTKVIPPGSTLGMLGDGQLGQMTAIAAANLGYKIAVLGPGGRDSPTGHVAYFAESWNRDGTVSDELLDEFCEVVGPDSAVMLEWENVPVELVERIKAKGIPVRPDSNVLAVAQDRLLEKQCAESLGIPVTKYENCEGAQHPLLYYKVQFDSILKTRRDGYDGKGQVRIPAAGSVDGAWNELRNVPCILERVVDFACEISMIIARTPERTVVYGPFENIHENGILRKTRKYESIGGLSPELIREVTITAQHAVEKLAEHLDVHGLLAVEFFVLKDGTVIFNEMAPRPHNSGHLTIECNFTSQFEQYVRAVCNLPFGRTVFHSIGEMHNILGDEANDWMDAVSWRRDLPGNNEHAAVHLYGKGEAKPGRKMGHITFHSIDDD
jgi:5-(carboxyamino)imidazole ribonucleotide synthase